MAPDCLHAWHLAGRIPVPVSATHPPTSHKPVLTAYLSVLLRYFTDYLVHSRSRLSHAPYHILCAATKYLGDYLLGRYHGTSLRLKVCVARDRKISRGRANKLSVSPRVPNYCINFLFDRQTPCAPSSDCRHPPPATRRARFLFARPSLSISVSSFPG